MGTLCYTQRNAVPQKDSPLQRQKAVEQFLSTVGTKLIDCRDRFGEWCASEIEKTRIEPSQTLQVHVHYIAWSKHYNEWISIKDDVICDCFGVCKNNTHRIATHGTQTTKPTKVQKTQDQLSVGDKIDCRSAFGKWHLSEIKATQINALQRVEAVYVHYIGFDHKHNDWVSVGKGQTCLCKDVCGISEHRIAIFETQSKFQQLRQAQLRQEKLQKLEEQKLNDQRLLKQALSRTMQIFVNTDMHNRTLTLSVKASDSIESLKTKICDKIQVPTHLQRLSTAYGKQLRDQLCLMDYGIHNESTLTVKTGSEMNDTQSKLMNESEKRKIEWSNHGSMGVHFSAKTNSCAYYNACVKAMQKYLNKSKITNAMFDTDGNKCFCGKCHKQRGDDEAYVRGNPSQTYVLPVGYVRFGIKLFSNQIKENILRDWHVVYHGTKAANVKDISESGLILLKPNDFKLNKYEMNKICSGHIQHKFIRTNKYTQRREEFDPQQIFTSPSCIYSSHYSDTINIDGNKVSFLFQCRQKPGSYCRGQETMRFGEKKIDQFVSNDSIEFYTKHNLDIAITGILIKIHK